MTLNLTELERVIALSAPLVAGARVREVRDDGARTLFLTLRVPGRNLVLVLSAEPTAARLAVTDDTVRRPVPPRPLAFTQALRKHLGGARVEALAQAVAGDRVSALELTRPRPPENAPTAALEDEADAGANLEIETGEGAPGSPDWPREHWRLVLELTGRSTALVLVDEAGTVRGSLDHPRDGRVGEPWRPPTASAPRTADATRELFAEASDGLALGAALEAHYAQTQGARAHTEAVRALSSALRRELKRATRRVAAIEADRQRAEDAALFRVYGDLLSAAFARLERGMTSIVLENFYDELRPLEVPLDPALTPRANIERYYTRHKKFRAALPGIAARLAQAEERQLGLELALEALAAIPDEDAEALAALRAEVAANLGVRPDEGPRLTGGERKRREQAARALPYRAFASANGTPIWVGRSARHNDTLTFALGRGNDLWLHAAGWAGSHVLVRLERGQDADGETLLDAATLAAHYSKAREGTIIEVHYTRQKHVRRARGGAPGQVYLSGARTLAVRLDPQRLARLMASTPPASAA